MPLSIPWWYLPAYLPQPFLPHPMNHPPLLSRILPIFVPALLILTTPVWGQAQSLPSEAGSLIVIGGGLDRDNEAVYRAILNERHGDGPVCVIPTAGGTPERSMESAVSRIDRWGGEGAAHGLLLTLDSPERADAPGVAEEMESCSGFFFTGGAQSRITDFFLPEGRETVAYTALLSRFLSGAVVAGSSAGAAMMSDPMIAGGSSAGALERGLGNAESEPGVRITRGMGLIDGVLFDQHFLARGRMGRLWVSVSEMTEVAWGAGIDEDTALLIRGHQAEVIGSSGVVLVAPAPQGMPEADHHRRNIRLRVDLLGTGDRLDLNTLSVEPDSRKTEVRGNGHSMGQAEFTGEGLFDRWTFLHLFTHIGSWQADQAVFTAHGRSIEIERGPGFRALQEPGGAGVGVEGTPRGLTVGPLFVTLGDADLTRP